MTGIFTGRQRGRQRSQRRLVARGRDLLAERRMGPLLVVFAAEARKSSLLGGGVRGRWPRGFGLQYRMKLFMRSILLGMSERDALWHNAEPHPPDRKPRQPGESGARERAAVVAADARGQAIRGERALEARARCLIRRMDQGVA